jgi:hypothetical protein
MGRRGDSSIIIVLVVRGRRYSSTERRGDSSIIIVYQYGVEGIIVWEGEVMIV